MNPQDWLQLGLFVSLIALLTKPIGLYLVQVLDAERRTWLDPALKPVERICRRLLGRQALREQNWKQYTLALLVFSAVGFTFTYALLRLQQVMPWNPENHPGLPSHLAFNTAVSFLTNTNWQSYGGESTLSHFSQMVGLTYHNFVSAAAGIGVAAAVVRGLARNGEGTVGNFWSDLVRVTVYLLLPLCLVLALFLISQGMVQNLGSYVELTTLEGGSQTVVQGPMASQVAIKMLGTNGGGFANANASHPFENPGPLSNLVQMVSIFAISSGLTWYLGRMLRNQAHGWAVWAAMMTLFIGGVVMCAQAEGAGNPIHLALGVDGSLGNMEGKEVRFGCFNTALFATVTTSASCGAVNGMHDSFTALGGLVPLLMMELGEVVFGGVGAGLYGMLVFVILAVFMAGLMVGRTPEYAGKKIQAREVKLAMLSLLILTLSILGFTAWACVSGWGREGLNNAGPHGFSEILYAFSSATANNGSAFAGLTAGTQWYNTVLGLAMLAGRFLVIVPIMAMAGGMAAKKAVPAGAGTLPVHGLTFVLLLVGTILLVGALNFLPALVLGPVVEHFLTGQGVLF